MIHKQIEWNDIQATVGLGCFYPDGRVEAGHNVNESAAEFHVMIELNAGYANAKEQYDRLEEAVLRLSKLPELKDATLVWKHYYVSDAINQAQYLTTNANEAVSVVQQPPLNGSKASMWLYYVEKTQMDNHEDGTKIMVRPHYNHLFNTQLHERSAGSRPIRGTEDATQIQKPAERTSPLMPLPTSIEHQTNRIFDRYSQSLKRQSCTLERNCIRTWVFVQGVDVQYAGMVLARRRFFEQEGMNPQTHYIASTGIEGRHIYPDVLVMMDAYAIEGIKSEQISYLKALTHLNPTYEYGVTFERGAAVDYGDRRHVFISGTASINNCGEIEHPLDVEKQTARTFENVQALLAEAEAGMSDVTGLIVYLRDTADYAIVKRYIETHYPTIPYLTVLAPVCRPGWLVEVECMAIKSVINKKFADF